MNIGDVSYDIQGKRLNRFGFEGEIGADIGLGLTIPLLRLWHLPKKRYLHINRKYFGCLHKL